MWKVHRIINFPKEERFTGDCTEDGLSLFRLHDKEGNRFILGPDRDWIGCFDAGRGRLKWSVGPKSRGSGPTHVYADLKRPSWISGRGDGTFVASSSSRGQVYALDPAGGSFSLLADLRPHGLLSSANCVFDGHGNIWVNDPGQARLWVLTHSGKLLRTLGRADGFEEPDAGKTGGVRAASPLEDMHLGEVYDIRCGNDGLVYILEGSRFRLRSIDFERDTAKLVAGTGVRGYSGDGGDPLQATFGGRGAGDFDGPWVFCLDDMDNIYVGDTHNRAVRMIDRERKSIRTIACGPKPKQGQRNDPEETDPSRLILPSICWMDYCDGFLYVSDEIGDLIVLGHCG